MRGSEQLFSAAERRVAVVALVVTVLVTVLSLTVGQSWSPPSLGPYGSDAYSVAASPDVLDARPVMSTPTA
jgi:hypothetical protein|tara:strand:+ start:1011 stop:1223 length:213 start_codon:yes stop_codon:yes gene_type:complete